MKDKEKGDGVDGFGSDKEWEEKEENTVEIVESDEVSYETARGPDWAMPSNRSSTLYLIL